MNPVFTLTIKNRSVEFERDKFNTYVKSLKDGIYSLVLLPAKSKKLRSNEENAYYHGVICKMIGEHIGENPSEVHELMKLIHNHKIIHLNGKEIKIPMSTATLSTVQFESYLTSIREWASSFLSLYLPLPNEIYQGA